MFEMLRALSYAYAQWRGLTERSGLANPWYLQDIEVPAGGKSLAVAPKGDTQDLMEALPRELILMLGEHDLTIGDLQRLAASSKNMASALRAISPRRIDRLFYELLQSRLLGRRAPSEPYVFPNAVKYSGSPKEIFSKNLWYLYEMLQQAIPRRLAGQYEGFSDPLNRGEAEARKQRAADDATLENLRTLVATYGSPMEMFNVRFYNMVAHAMLREATQNVRLVFHRLRHDMVGRSLPLVVRRNGKLRETPSTTTLLLDQPRGHTRAFRYTLRHPSGTSTSILFKSSDNDSLDELLHIMLPHLVVKHTARLQGCPGHDPAVRPTAVFSIEETVTRPVLVSDADAGNVMGVLDLHGGITHRTYKHGEVNPPVSTHDNLFEIRSALPTADVPAPVIHVVGATTPAVRDAAQRFVQKEHPVKHLQLRHPQRTIPAAAGSSVTTRTTRHYSVTSATGTYGQQLEYTVVTIESVYTTTLDAIPAFETPLLVDGVRHLPYQLRIEAQHRVAEIVVEAIGTIYNKSTALMRYAMTPAGVVNTEATEAGIIDARWPSVVEAVTAATTSASSTPEDASVARAALSKMAHDARAGNRIEQILQRYEVPAYTPEFSTTYPDLWQRLYDETSRSVTRVGTAVKILALTYVLSPKVTVLEVDRFIEALTLPFMFDGSDPDSSIHPLNRARDALAAREH